MLYIIQGWLWRGKTFLVTFENTWEVSWVFMLRRRGTRKFTMILEQPSVSTELPVGTGWGSTRTPSQTLAGAAAGVWVAVGRLSLQEDAYSTVTLKLNLLWAPVPAYVHMYVDEMHRKDADQLLRVRKGGGRGRAGFSFHTSIRSLKDAGKYMKILANFQLCYMNIMSYFLYFSVFFKIRTEVMAGTLHL